MSSSKSPENSVINLEISLYVANCYVGLADSREIKGKTTKIPFHSVKPSTFSL